MTRIIDPIVEYAELDHHPNRNDESEHSIHPFYDYRRDGEGYWGTIVEKLISTKSGVYIFYDSRGLPLYVGKTEFQSLWERIGQSFRKTRGNERAVMLVDHPSADQEYDSNKHKVQKIRRFEPALSETARYLSVYHVHRENVAEIEALLIRSMANSLINIKMEGRSALSGPMGTSDEN